MNSYQQIWVYIKFSIKLFIKNPGLYTLKTAIRFFSAWKGHLPDRKVATNSNIPWLTFPSIDFLQKRISKQMIAFEYGSGRSTLFWSERIKQVISVEHDREWYEKMKIELDKRNIANVTYFLIEPEHDDRFTHKSSHNPNDYISDDQAYVNMNFETYAKKINSFPSNYFDIIVIDGRARPSCIKDSIPKIRKNGYLIIDNTERSYYLAPFDFDKTNWRKWDFPGPVPSSYTFSQTTILQKISE